MKIRSHKYLETYQLAFKSAMEIFELTKEFPKEERYSLTDQIPGKLVNMALHPEKWNY
jgi:hypothetical protein